MVRFDFVIDLKVYLMEANMSPNLSSAHFPANALLYEQVVFFPTHLFGLNVNLVDGRWCTVSCDWLVLLDEVWLTPNKPWKSSRWR